MDPGRGFRKRIRPANPDQICACCSCHAELRGAAFCESFVVGDFPAQEARGFLDSCLQQAGQPEVVDADWEAVHKVGHSMTQCACYLQVLLTIVYCHTQRHFSRSIAQSACYVHTTSLLHPSSTLGKEDAGGGCGGPARLDMHTPLSPNLRQWYSKGVVTHSLTCGGVALPAMKPVAL